jgi:hypothetical protein
MLYNKITYGYVEQIFDNKGTCLCQRFIADDYVEFEEKDGDIIAASDMPLEGKEYFPLNMVQPEQEH